jgi:hypothetical protein
MAKTATADESNLQQGSFGCGRTSEAIMLRTIAPTNPRSPPRIDGHNCRRSLRAAPGERRAAMPEIPCRD